MLAGDAGWRLPRSTSQVVEEQIRIDSAQADAAEEAARTVARVQRQRRA